MKKLDTGVFEDITISNRELVEKINEIIDVVNKLNTPKCICSNPEGHIVEYCDSRCTVCSDKLKEKHEK